MARGGSYQEVSIGTTDTLLLPQSNHRRVVIISNPTANPLYVAIGKTAVALQSLVIPSGQIAQKFLKEDFGGLIDQDWHALFGTGAGVAAVVVGYD